MKKITKIGVFDSGVGGLSVLKSLISDIHFGRVIYYGDTARVPYGNKDRDTIVRFCLEALEFFNNFSLDLLVVACNTASAFALKAMRECSKIPIIGVIESGVMALNARRLSLDSNILVIATEATIKSGVYDSALRNLGYKNITNIATNLFVSLVEENIFSGKIIDSVFSHYFKDIEKPSAVILGCTHFPLLLESLRKYFGKSCIFIHSGEAIAHFIAENFAVDFAPECIESKGQHKTHIEFFASDNVAKLKHTAKLWLQGTSYTSN